MNIILRFCAFCMCLALLVAAHSPLTARAADQLARHGLLGAAVVMAGPVVTVQRVIPGSAAQDAGVRAGDQIAAVDGVPVTSVADFLEKVRRPAGRSITLELRRSGAPLVKTIVMRAPPDEHAPGVATIYGSVAIDGTLRRTLMTMPIHAQRRLPAVFLVGGIGCYSVDTANAHDPYRNIAQDVSRSGFIVFRLEKSGVGDSQGPPCSGVDFNTEYHSYQTALSALFQNPAVDPKHVYILGHSIGTLIAPRLALTSPVAGLIVADGVGVNWFEYELLNAQRQLILSGDDPADVDKVVADKEYCMHRLLIEKRSPQQIVAERPSCAQQIQYPAAPAYMQQVAALNVAQPWTRVATPVLVIYGASDFVTSESDHRRIAGIINQYHPGHAELDVIPGMNHDLSDAASPQQFMQQVQNGTPMVYDGRFSADVVAWLCRREHCERADPPVAQTLPLVSWDSRIMLPVRVNGRGPFWFIMDTGDPAGVALTPETARAIHLRTSAGASQSGAGERSVSSLRGTVQTLAVGSLQFRGLPVDVIDLSQIRKNLKFPHLDGVIGYSILQGLHVLVDQDAGTVTLSFADLAHPKTAHQVPFSLQNNFIHVPAQIDATGGTIVIDTGDRSSFTIFGRFAHEHHFYGKYPGPRNVLTGFGIGGPIYGDVFKLPNLEVFGFALHGIVTRASRQHAGAFASSPEAGSAGGNLLRRFNIIYDYPHRELVVWPSSLFNAADVYVPLRNVAAPRPGAKARGHTGRSLKAYVRSFEVAQYPAA